MRSICVFRQSVPRSHRSGYVLSRVSVGHQLISRGCPTLIGPKSAVGGVGVGHFGGREKLPADIVSYPLAHLTRAVAGSALDLNLGSADICIKRSLNGFAY